MNQKSELTWVYSDPVCDLFHAGHVEFFKRARALGDRLVVGLMSDRDASTYKPAPIMTFAERHAVVSACRYVDRVLEMPGPLHCTNAFLDSIGASFACHGDDMDIETLHYFYADLVPTDRLRVVPYASGISSRTIIERIVDRARQGALRVTL